MTPIELMADFVNRNAELVKVTLADFSDSDMLARPTPGANHAAWQVGHLAGSAFYMIGQVAPGMIPELAGQLGEKCNSKTASTDDPAFFPKKSELLEVFSAALAAMVKWVKTLVPDDLDKPIPGRLANFAPTIGHLVLMSASHLAMHVGQLQVIRRKLGKPLLF